MGSLRTLGPVPVTAGPPLPPPKPPQDDFEPPQEPRWKPYALASVMLVGAVAGVRQGKPINLASNTPVVMKEGKLLYLPPTEVFAEDQDWTARQLVVKVRLPGDGLVASLRVQDAQGRVQSTRWTEGQCDVHNPNYDEKSRLLTLRFQPSSAEVDEHGLTDEGFDPRRIRSVQLLLVITKILVP